MISIGPFALDTVIVAVAVFFAWLVARLLAQRLTDPLHRKAVSGLILDALFLGLLAARLGYIAQWWGDYSVSPWSMLALGDGGFSWWVGGLAAVAFAWWRTHSPRAPRHPVLAGLLAGMLIWGAAGAVMERLPRAALALPDQPLVSMDGKPIVLRAYSGKPMVINLWATWCPPCRREMPVLAQAQSVFPDVVFVMVNQGESAPAIHAFLEREGLQFAHVLRDPTSLTMHAVGSRGLPTTLFFDEQGRLTDSHVGELTMARLKSIMLRRFPQPSPSSKHRE